ncbi:probable serine/threonine-protein kinase PBL26 isoform X2 [Rutidosis leptorrhynchoides]|uniref:probable serine/threonine-protein kinase PBL26 isoform X2 n=1 Tax=Rutidosis leptorrhynchoides TaxID=125765 RepID=UPI003A998808
MTLVFEHSFNQCELYTMIYSSEFDFTWEKRLKVSLDISHGLYYLHSGMKDQKKVMHRDISPHNIKVVYESNLLVADSFKAYIAGFQNAVLLTENQHDDALQLDDTRKMTFYTDPEFANNGKLNVESNVFSLGVILFEIFCGKSAEHILITESLQNTRLEHVVASWLKKGIIKNKMASVLKNKNIENALFQYQGLNKDSLDTFIAIACQCLLELPNQRSTIKVIIQELEKSLSFQKNHKIETFGMPFEKIKLATKNFSRVIGEGGFGSVYIGELAQKHRYGHCAIVVKKLDTSHGQGHPQYYNELQILYKYEHENVIGLIGYSDETDERLIVYERAPKGSLDRYLNDVKLTWRKRLMICIDIASGLDFLHGGVEGQEVVIHRDIKTPNILLFDDWKAKLGDFGLSLISNIDKDTHYAIDRACGTKGYVDPFYLKTYLLTTKSDIYSFGVVLFEILCGKEIHKIPNREGQSLLSFIKHKFEEGKQDEIVFRVIKEEIAPKSLTTFIDIVYMCLDDDTKKRLSSKEVLAQLKKALQLQEEEDIKALPEDHKKKLVM